MKITMIHELDIGFFASTMRKSFEKMGHEVTIIQASRTGIEDSDHKIDYLLNDPKGIHIPQIHKEMARTDFFILRWIGDPILKMLAVPYFAHKDNSIYKIHGSEMREMGYPYSLTSWHLEWYHREPTVCGPRDPSLKDIYQSGVITHIERPLDFEVMPKPKTETPPFAITTPTSTYKKGTEELVEAMKEAEMPLKVVHNVTRSECLEEKSKASLFIDRLGNYEHGPYGMNSAEAWYMSIPVFSQVSSLDFVFCPELRDLITPITPYSLIPKVKDFVENPKKYTKKARKARKYVKRVHDSEVIAQQYIDLAESIMRR